MLALGRAATASERMWCTYVHPTYVYTPTHVLYMYMYLQCCASWDLPRGRPRTSHLQSTKQWHKCQRIGLREYDPVAARLQLQDIITLTNDDLLVANSGKATKMPPLARPPAGTFIQHSLHRTRRRTVDDAAQSHGHLHDMVEPHTRFATGPTQVARSMPPDRLSENPTGAPFRVDHFRSSSCSFAIALLAKGAWEDLELGVLEGGKMSLGSTLLSQW
jgi:hypothetical protein